MDAETVKLFVGFMHDVGAPMALMILALTAFILVMVLILKAWPLARQLVEVIIDFIRRMATLHEGTVAEIKGVREALPHICKYPGGAPPECKYGHLPTDATR